MARSSIICDMCHVSCSQCPRLPGFPSAAYDICTSSTWCHPQWERTAMANKRPDASLRPSLIPRLPPRAKTMESYVCYLVPRLLNQTHITLWSGIESKGCKLVPKVSDLADVKHSSQIVSKRVYKTKLSLGSVVAWGETSQSPGSVSKTKINNLGEMVQQGILL